MFPPRPGKRRVRGVVKPQVAFRLPTTFHVFFATKEELGYSKTDIVLDLMQVAFDLSNALGDDYYEAEKVSKIEGIPTGAVLARWAKAGMKKK